MLCCRAKRNMFQSDGCRFLWPTSSCVGMLRMSFLHQTVPTYVRCFHCRATQQPWGARVRPPPHAFPFTMKPTLNCCAFVFFRVPAARTPDDKAKGDVPTSVNANKNGRAGMNEMLAASTGYDPADTVVRAVEAAVRSAVDGGADTPYRPIGLGLPPAAAGAEAAKVW